METACQEASPVDNFKAILSKTKNLTRNTRPRKFCKVFKLQYESGRVETVIQIKKTKTPFAKFKAFLFFNLNLLSKSLLNLLSKQTV